MVSGVVCRYKVGIRVHVRTQSSCQPPSHRGRYLRVSKSNAKRERERERGREKEGGREKECKRRETCNILDMECNGMTNSRLLVTNRVTLCACLAGFCFSALRLVPCTDLARLSCSRLFQNKATGDQSHNLAVA